MLGVYHEISVRTDDILASVEFYETLGFRQCVAGDTWPHPYGVLTDGRIFVGLHQYRFPSPAITFVRHDIARHASEFTALGIELAFAKTGDESFNEIGFLDPAGQMITILEARTYSPPPADARSAQESRCGWFSEFSIPTADFAASAAFWERLGFVAHTEAETPYLSQPLISDRLTLALHRPRTCDQPMLVFRDPAMRQRVAALHEAGIALDPELPRGLDPAANAMLRSPEGTPLLLLQED
jgi:catechol 2,3-dioxygenase-like lactoylglutathione lyase family enzyme